MRSKLFLGEVTHSRLSPVTHSFRYPIYSYVFDLDELSELARKIPFFGYNKINVVSIHDSDYLGVGDESIREKLFSYLRDANCADGIVRIELVTGARYLNYVFNPVSFYYCYRLDGSVRVTVAEVNNTFHERHLYILDNSKEGVEGFITRYTVKKAFHVSPFNDMQADYDFHFSSLERDVDIRINVLREGKAFFLTRMHGTTVPLTTISLLKTIVSTPVRAVLTIPRIYFQAAIMHYKKKMPIISKPNPSSDLTIRVASPTLWENICMAFMRRALRGLDSGTLTVQFPDKSVESFSGHAAGERAAIRLNNYYIFPKLVRDGSIGLGDSYVNGDWESDDVVATLRFFLNNWSALAEGKLNVLKPFRWLNRFYHVLRQNSLKGSKGNISAHYDLSNELFRQFLDPSMTYSSALFSSPDEDLEKAQLNKIDAILDSAQISESDHVLEIGSGWGSLALRAVERFGCRVTSISLSQEQLKFARERAVERGYDTKITFAASDYREVHGRFDKIVSVEMLEAVGHRYLDAFFSACERLLKTTGVAVLQVIAFPDGEYKNYLRRQDWIQKRVFPGSHLPSLGALVKAMGECSDLVVEKITNIGPHYAHTLREWRTRFERNWKGIEALGFDEVFKRTWNFYLASCEAEFATRWLAVYQVVLTRPNNQVLISEDRRKLATSPKLEIVQRRELGGHQEQNGRTLTARSQ